MVAPWMFEPLFRKVPGIGEDWQIALEKEGNKDRLEFRMESQGTAESSQIRERFLTVFREELPDAWKLYQMDLCKLDAKVFPKGTLRDERKLKRIVDNRKF